MSRDYGRVRTQFWGDDKVNPWPVDRKLMALYLLTSPHSTALGAFYLNVAYAAADIGVPRDEAKRLLRELDETGWLVWCEKTQWVWIVNYLGHNPPENGNVRKHIVGLFGQVPRAVSFRDRVGTVVDALPIVPPGRFQKGSDTVGEPLGNCSPTATGEGAHGGKTVSPPDTLTPMQGGETVRPPDTVIAATVVEPLAKGSETVAEGFRKPNPTEPIRTEPNPTDPLASLANARASDGVDAGAQGGETVSDPAPDDDLEPPPFLRRSTNAPEPKPGYPAEFEAFADAYPHPSAAWSKPATFDAWGRAVEAIGHERLMAAVSAYRAEIARDNARRRPNDPRWAKQAVNWLCEECFEGFLIADATAEAAKILARTQTENLWGGKGAWLAKELGAGTANMLFAGSTLEVSPDGKAAVLTVEKAWQRSQIIALHAQRIEDRLGGATVGIVVRQQATTDVQDATVQTPTA